MAIALIATSLAAAAIAFAADGDTPKPDKKSDKPAAPKVIKLDGEIGKLDLTEAQKTDILKLRTDAKTQVAALQEQIKKIMADEKAKEVALLTPEQQTQLTALEDARKAAEEAKRKAAATQKAGKDAPKDTAKPDSKLP
jgi:Spy/CpxP family protein refolding chaperone